MQESSTEYIFEQGRIFYFGLDQQIKRESQIVNIVKVEILGTFMCNIDELLMHHRKEWQNHQTHIT